MSPRRTHSLHEVGDGQHLGPVVFVGFQSCDFGSQDLFVVSSRCCLDQGRSDCFGAAHSRCFKLPESPQGVVIEAYRNCLSHVELVYHDT